MARRYSRNLNVDVCLDEEAEDAIRDFISRLHTRLKEHFSAGKGELNSQHTFSAIFGFIGGCVLSILWAIYEACVF